MHLTRFTDYSLRVLMYAAARADRRVTIGEVAQAFTISRSHLTKVVHFLGREGLLRNLRGRGGGFELARPAEHINVGAVVRAADVHESLVECFDREQSLCAITPICRLRPLLAAALEAFYSVLDQYTLADITRNRAQLREVLLPRASHGGNRRAASRS